jgi:hypothetical protein
MLQLTLNGNKDAFRPGDEISGQVQWESAEQPTRAEVQLSWSTRGKGSEDAETVESLVLEDLKPQDQRTFRFTAPAEPCSFSGTLISLVWSVELFVEPGTESARQEIVIAPDAREIILHSQPEPTALS